MFKRVEYEMLKIVFFIYTNNPEEGEVSVVEWSFSRNQEKALLLKDYQISEAIFTTDSTR